MDWEDARVLLALLRARNLHAAAAKLKCDASTVSRRIARLEDSVGARLFSRTRDGLKPTAVALRLRAHAEAMEEAAAALVRAVDARETRASGTIRVATTEGFARVLVAEGLLSVRDEHPDLALEILGENQPADLARGDADIAVRVAVSKQPSLRVRSIASMSIGLFAAPQYLRARGVPRSAPSLRGHDVLLPSGSLDRLPEVKWLAARPGVRVVFRSNSMPTLIAAAVAAQGLVPLPVAWGDNEAGLDRVLELDAIPARKVWLVTHESSADRVAVQVVSKRIISIFERLFPR